MIHLDEAAVRAALRWPTLIDAMERALADFSSGGVIHPVRSILTIEEHRRYLGIMPAVAGDVMGAKLVSFYPGNERTPNPTHNGVIVLLDTRTGVPLASIDARLITEMRTAAVSAAVTRRLMPENARALAVLGSGVQAGAHVEALAQVARFDDIRVWSRTREHAERFAQAHGAIATDAESAVRDADVVVVATSSQSPVLRGTWLKPGAHVNSVGANRPHWRELDDESMRNTVIVDSREATSLELGDVILSGAAVYAEAGELFSGAKPTPPRSLTTVFKSGGLAIEDLAAAKLVMEFTPRRRRARPK
ncbi:MAG: ornithine cyclodeaminase family protein [Candidatus Eremiobacteraeota bacterium]|nr:ornithine cyclodeaminase family protein [Candidatus Eremiobacteraeota bacterium]